MTYRSLLAAVRHWMRRPKRGPSDVRLTVLDGIEWNTEPGGINYLPEWWLADNDIVVRWYNAYIRRLTDPEPADLLRWADDGGPA